MIDSVQVEQLATRCAHNPSPDRQTIGSLTRNFSFSSKTPALTSQMSLDESNSNSSYSDVSGNKERSATATAGATAAIPKTYLPSVDGQFPFRNILPRICRSIGWLMEVMINSRRWFRSLRNEMKRQERREEAKEEEQSPPSDDEGSGPLGTMIQEPILTDHKRVCIGWRRSGDGEATDEDGGVCDPSKYATRKINTPSRPWLQTTDTRLEESEPEGPPSPPEYMFGEENDSDLYEPFQNTEYLDYVLECGIDPRDTIRLVVN